MASKAPGFEMASEAPSAPTEGHGPVIGEVGAQEQPGAVASYLKDSLERENERAAEQAREEERLRHMFHQQSGMEHGTPTPRSESRDVHEIVDREVIEAERKVGEEQFPQAAHRLSQEAQIRAATGEGFKVPPIVIKVIDVIKTVVSKVMTGLRFGQ
ncbi:hypothetical protein HY024_03280 [Candidatus Curtissbacteria bacterium]|nr:hypothetical protein [Candidatus Curtissbacteria bacterium]